MPTLPTTRQNEPIDARTDALLDRNALAQAFASFNHVAGSLEQSYTLLQGELSRLRKELEHRNQDLARSLAENQTMRAYLACILEALPCGVIVAGPGQSFRFANPCAVKLMARDTQSTDTDVLPESLQPVLAEVRAAEPGSERLWQRDAPEGKRHVAVSCAGLQLGLASARENVFILRDITEQVRSEAERETSRRMQALAEMTALLAHEIRNPLGSMELFAGLIKDATRNDAEVSQWIMHLQAGLRVLSATVNNVLHFHSAAPLQMTPVPLDKLLADTLEFLQPLALQRGMVIEFAPSGRRVMIRGEAFRLQQVFLNLSTNAFRAMRQGKKLRVSVHLIPAADPQSVRVDFEDEGSGIAAEHLKHIFEAGYTTTHGSPGLGLAVCQHIAAQHGGKFCVHSEVGRGTTFSITFPVWRSLV
jgi:signal transduction histidine kinase